MRGVTTEGNSTFCHAERVAGDSGQAVQSLEDTANRASESLVSSEGLLSSPPSYLALWVAAMIPKRIWKSKLCCVQVRLFPSSIRTYPCAKEQKREPSQGAEEAVSRGRNTCRFDINQLCVPTLVPHSVGHSGTVAKSL